MLEEFKLVIYMRKGNNEAQCHSKPESPETLCFLATPNDTLLI